MPTLDLTDVFKKDLASLDHLDRKRFQKALKSFVEDLTSAGHGLRPALRIKSVQGAPGVYEMTCSLGPEAGPGSRRGANHRPHRHRE
jgi:hypothetical protein